MFIVTLSPITQHYYTLLIKVCFDIKNTFQPDICGSDIKALKGGEDLDKGCKVSKLLLWEAVKKLNGRMEIYETRERELWGIVIQSLWSGKRFKVKACEDYALTISLSSPPKLEHYLGLYSNLYKVIYTNYFDQNIKYWFVK